MTRRIPAQYQYRGAHARRHPLRDRNKHRLTWGECDWKLHNLGHARAVKGKEQAIAAAEGLLGRPAQSSDEADAVVLAHWASLNAEVKEGSD